MTNDARVLGMILAAVTAGAPPAQASAAKTHAVRVGDQAAAEAAALSLKPIRRSDYRSFQWLELSEADYTRLAASGIPFEPDADAGEVRVAGFHFDPLADGEPVVAARLAASGSGPQFRLVQLAGPVTDAWLGALSASGARVLQYYPHNTYLVWADGTQSAALASFDFVRWEGAFHPAYKIHHGLGGRHGLIANVDVMFFDDGDVPRTLGLIAAAGGEIIQHYPSQPDRAFWNASVRLPASAIEAIARLANVLWLGYQSPVPGLDDEMSCQIEAGNYSTPPPVPFTGYASWLSTVGLDGAGVRWATIDTGVDYQHPDLATHIAGGYSFPGACAPAGEPGSDCSGGGHGTHVTGIIGGNAAGLFADALGFKYGFGIAPSYEIFAMNSLSGAGWPPAGGWQEHSKRAVLGSAIGGNNSWTTSEGTNTGYIASCRTHDLMVRDGNFDTATVAEPFIEVFSAGNSGPSPSSLTSPKEAKNLIVVASSLNFRAGSIDSISSFSSRGPAVDGRWVPTVAAPGSTIASSRSDLGGSCASPIAGTNNLYAFCSGTSMAAPHVSGAIVLATDWWRGFNAGSNPSPAMAKALLVNTAVDMNEPAPIPIPNIHEGWGRVHLGNLFASNATRFYRDQQDVFANAGETRVYSIRVADPSRPLKVTLAWSDAPGAPGANPALVNNLDLTVVNGANTYRGNVFSAGWSATGGAPDTRNNLENVYVQSPSLLATITITAINLPGDGVPYDADVTDQDFALVCSNCATAALGPTALSVDASGNGVWEPAESAVIAPSWRNGSQQIVGPVTGAIASTAPITITDAAASYGMIAPAATASCASASDCYAATASGPRPGQHWDAVVDETLTPNFTHAWRIHVGGSFADVPVSDVRYRFVETVLHNDVTAGCNSTSYCPESSTTREQMAVFVLVSKEGSSYLPPACATPMFNDVPASSPFCRWIEELARRGVVGGCGGGAYCPAAAVSREQMPIFVLRTKEGGAYFPPACGATPLFNDVPVTSAYCRWIEEFARRGISTGCGGGNYCPLAPVTRGQMAVFLTVGFSLVLYGV